MLQCCLWQQSQRDTETSVESTHHCLLTPLTVYQLPALISVQCYVWVNYSQVPFSSQVNESCVFPVVTAPKRGSDPGTVSCLEVQIQTGTEVFWGSALLKSQWSISHVAGVFTKGFPSTFKSIQIQCVPVQRSFHALYTTGSTGLAINLPLRSMCNSLYSAIGPCLP